MTGQDLRKLASVARMGIEAFADRQLAQADLADCYITCAADQLDQGNYTHAVQLCRRAGEICKGYDQIHAGLGGAL